MGDTKKELVVNPPSFKIGKIKQGKLESPGLIEVIGAHMGKPYDRPDDQIRVPYIVKIGVRVPSWNGHRPHHNVAHMYRWYDFYETKDKENIKLPKDYIKSSLDFMLFEAAAAYEKMGYEFDLSMSPDGDKMTDYIISRIVTQSRGFLTK